MFHYFSNDYLSEKNGESATISLKNWFALWAISLVNLIPVVGLIVFIILYLKLGLKPTTAPSIRNYIKLCLIFTGIIAVVSVVYSAVFLLVFAGAA